MTMKKAKLRIRGPASTKPIWEDGCRNREMMLKKPAGSNLMCRFLKHVWKPVFCSSYKCCTNQIWNNPIQIPTLTRQACWVMLRQTLAA